MDFSNKSEVSTKTHSVNIAYMIKIKTNKKNKTK